MPDTPARPELPEGTPERIYLVLGTDEGIVPIPFAQLDEVTWCEDQIDEADPEFIRADVVQRLRADERRKALSDVNDGGEVMGMWLCESRRLVLRIGQIYRFKVDPTCKFCLEMKTEHDEAYMIDRKEPTT